MATLLLLLGVYPTASHAAVGDKLNTKILGKLLFNETFKTMPVIDTGCSSTTARYVDQFCGQGDANSTYPRTHGEHECYSDTAFDGVNPFSLARGGGALTITANNGFVVEPACASTKYTSGMLSTYNSFSMAHGYWQVTVQMPPGGQGRWPAIWLLKAHAGGQWPPELDIVEMAQGVFNGSQRSINNQDVTIAVPSVGCLCDKPHVLGFLDTGTELVWYVDGVEVEEQQMMAGTDVSYYLIINLAIDGYNWTGAETPTSAPTSMKLTSIQAYSLK